MCRWSDHITYCSQIQTPYLIKDITFLEKIQRRATNFMLKDYSLDYRSRLISFHLLPLMYLYELSDVLFFVRSLKFPDPSFPIKDYISFSKAPTRSASSSKLSIKSSSTSLSRHTYFCRLVRIWNALPSIDLSLSYSTIKFQLKRTSGIIFFLILILLCLVPSM